MEKYKCLLFNEKIKRTAVHGIHNLLLFNGKIAIILMRNLFVTTIRCWQLYQADIFKTEEERFIAYVADV